MESDPALDPVTAVAALGDTSRRTVYEWVLAARREVGRDDVAAALGMVRSTAAFHLDRLAKEGLLVVSYRRLSGRSGPGSGRPTKMYARAEGEIAVSLPARHYDLAGDLLAAAIEDSIEAGCPVVESLKRVATAAGQEIRSNAEGQEPAQSLEDVLKYYGYEPVLQDDGSIVLLNCPFHRLARKHTDTVCGLNVALLASITEASSGDREGRKAVLDPAPGRCCVRITA